MMAIRGRVQRAGAFVRSGLANPALPRWVLAALLLGIGAVVTAGGVWLIALGGSFYYLLAGAAVLGSGVLTARGDRRGAWIFAAFLVASLIWSLWEAGLDGWALTARLLAPAVLGLCFAYPRLFRDPTTRFDQWAPRAAPIVALLCIVAIAVGGMQQGPPRLPFPDASEAPFQAAGDEWAAYGGVAAGTRYSMLAQLTPANVSQLEVAWTHSAGAIEAGARSPMQVTPIMIGDTLYYCSQTNAVIALDPETGEERWRFDPEVGPPGPGFLVRCRGVAHHRSNARECPERIISATFDARLFALDARTGALCRSFGDGGYVDLTEGLGDVQPGFYYVSSAPLIARDKIVVGGAVIDNMNVDEPSGVIRAYDVETGALSWAWDLGRPDERGAPPEGETYTRSTPNSWAPATADEALGLVYLPLGNPTPDYWGADRTPEEERFGSSVVALDAETGALRWSFQTMHHDLWDYDVPAQPTLVDIERDGQVVPALVQVTKRGQLFVLDRRTGEPVAAVEERPVAQTGAAPGERLSPTQPYSVGMPSFGGVLRERDMWGVTPIDQLWCRIAFKRLRYDGEATPPGETASLVYPGVAGGMNWGGVSIDPVHGVAIVNSMYVAATNQLIPRERADEMARSGGDAPQGMTGAPYGAQVSTFYSPLNVPCNEPPYGRLSAVDLRTGALLWQRPVGTTRDTGPFGIATHLPIPMGLPNLGGTLTTQGGLVFMGAARERRFRAFDIRTGREVWSAALPSGGQANPMTYVSPRSGRQFVVIAAGGHPVLDMPPGDTLVAFAVP
jgi:membrane-bound PQQ-dependent dehydrogenase (glucose/quinate/shikimate family)